MAHPQIFIPDARSLDSKPLVDAGLGDWVGQQEAMAIPQGPNGGPGMLYAWRPGRPQERLDYAPDEQAWFPQDVGKRTLAGSVAAAQVFQEVSSAKGKATNRVGLQATELALRVTPKDSAAAAENASRWLDLMKQSGETDLKKIAGFATQGQLASRLVDLRTYGTNAVPAILSGMRSGASAEYSAELFALISASTGDKTGAETKTGVQNFLSRMQDFVPATSGKDARGRFTVPQNQIAAFNAAKTPEQKIGVIQSSPELRRQLFGSNVIGEGPTKTAITSFLSGDAKAMAEFRDIQKKILPISDKAQPGEFDAYLKRLNTGRYQAGIEARQESRQNVEQRRLAEKANVQATKIFEETLEEVDLKGWDWPLKTGARQGFGANQKIGGKDATTAAVEVLQGLSGATAKDQRTLDQAIETIQKLDQSQIDLTGGSGWTSEIIAEMRKQTELMEKQGGGGLAPQREPAAAALRRNN